MAEYKITEESERILKKIIGNNLVQSSTEGAAKLCSTFGGWESGRASMEITKITGYKAPMIREPELFDNDIIRERDKEIYKELADDEAITYERGNKDIDLTPKMARLMFALSKYITTPHRADTGTIPEEIREVIEWTEKKERLEKKLHIGTPKSVSLKVDLKELARDVCGRTTKESIEYIRSGLLFLDGTFYKKHNTKMGGDILLKVLNIGAMFKDTEEGRFSDFVIIDFGPVFLWNINKRYAGLPNKIFEVLRKSGNGGALLMALFSRAISVYYYFNRAAKEERKKGEKEHLEPEELAEKIQSALTWRISAPEILEAIKVDYTSDRRYRSKFIKDFEKAIKALKEMELISNGYIEFTPKKRPYKFVIVFNENYNKPKITKEGTGEDA